MKRIDMASGEPARTSTVANPPSIASATHPERFDSGMDEAQQVDRTYAFWTSLFALPQASLQERLVELGDLRSDSDDQVEHRKLDAAIHALAFVLRMKATMPDVGSTLV